MQPLELERSEQRFAARIVPAVALSAHRTAHSPALEQVLEFLAGLLAATVAVEYQSSFLGRLAPEPGHAQGVDGQLARHAFAQAPTDHLATEQDDDHRQVQTVFPKPWARRIGPCSERGWL